MDVVERIWKHTISKEMGMKEETYININLSNGYVWCMDLERKISWTEKKELR